MKKNQKGDLVLVQVPGETKEEFFSLAKKLSKKATKEKLQALIDHTPCRMLKNITAEQAQKIIIAFNKIGVKALFRPVKIAVDQPSSVAKESTKKRVSDLGEQNVAKINAPKRKRSAALVACLVILLGVGGYLNKEIIIGAYGGAEPAAKKPIPSKKRHSRPKGNPHGAVELHSYFLDQNIDPIDGFEMAHSPWLDRRLLEGFSRAVKMMGKSDPAFSGATVVTEVKHTQVDDFSVNVVIKKPGTPDFTSIITLSTAPGKIEANLDTLSKLFEDSAKTFGSVNRAPSNKSATSIRDQVESFDYVAIHKALAEAGDLIRQNPAQPDLWLAASEGYGWLAFARLPKAISSRRRQQYRGVSYSFSLF